MIFFFNFFLSFDVVLLNREQEDVDLILFGQDCDLQDLKKRFDQEQADLRRKHEVELAEIQQRHQKELAAQKEAADRERQQLEV